MYEAEIKYRGIRALVTFPNSEDALFRGRFLGIAGEVVSFEGRDLDELAVAFRKAVDEYLVQETADTLLQRIVSSDHPEPWTTEREKRRYLVGIYKEMDEMERDESIPDLFKRAEDLAAKISRKVRGWQPSKIVQRFDEAARRGVEKALKTKVKKPVPKRNGKKAIRSDQGPRKPDSGMDRNFLRRSLKGRESEIVPTEEIENFAGIYEELIERLFGLGPGEYLITDESSLYDFMGTENSEVPDLQKTIRDVYGVDTSDIRNGSLVEIFKRIKNSKKGKAE